MRKKSLVITLLTLLVLPGLLGVAPVGFRQSGGEPLEPTPAVEETTEPGALTKATEIPITEPAVSTETPVPSQTETPAPTPTPGGDTEPEPPAPGDPILFPPEPLDPLEKRILSGASSVSAESAATVDTFGYTRSIPNPGIAWDDLTGTGTQASFADPDESFAGPIPIGFNFKFYENTYSTLYISTNGLVTFGQGSSYQFGGFTLPDDTEPNNVIAPFWADLVVGNYNSGKVYYKYINTGNDATSRFVVEWNQVTRLEGQNTPSGLYTFQIALFKNGNILFQYQTLTGDKQRVLVGIEDADGADGLLYLFNAPGLVQGQDILFTRPADGRRSKFMPGYQGAFAANGSATFSITLKNTGTVGDTFNLTTASTDSSWSLQLLSSSNQALTDSNHDGKLDVGYLDPLASKSFKVRLGEPDGALAGSRTLVTLTSKPATGASHQAQTKIQSAIPAPFAQAYADQKNVIAPWLSFNWAERSTLLSISDWFSGSSLAVSDTPQKTYVYAWEKDGSIVLNQQLVQFSDIEFLIVNRFGLLVKPVHNLTQNSQYVTTSQTVSGRYPSMAALPNGKVGVIWTSDIDKDFWNPDIQQTNSNVYFTLLSAAGLSIKSPFSVTQNSGWRTKDALQIPRYSAPRIAALSDNRFILGWVEEKIVNNISINDIYITVVDENGNVLTKTRLTNSQADGSLYSTPTLAALSGGEYLIAYTKESGAVNNFSIAYTVRNSAGGVLKPATDIQSASGLNPDAVQLSSGKLLLAWSGAALDTISYAVLDGSSYNVTFGPQNLKNPNPRVADNVSVTRDKLGNGILTWMDGMMNQYLYYALVGSDGSVLTAPMHFYTVTETGTAVLTNNAGQGNATYEGGWVTNLPAVLRNQ